MQKKLIAVAVAGLVSTGAMAQVTMYGVADATLDMVKATGATGGQFFANFPAGVTSEDVPRFSRVSTNSSLWGVRGTEDLGGGMSAMFQYESAIGFDAGTGTLAVRDSYVGVGGGFGKVLFGNLTGPTRGLGASLDVFAGATGIGANSGVIGKIGNASLSGNDAASNISLSTQPSTSACGRSSTCASVFDTRWKNALAYVSPALGPVTVTAVYVANENRSFDGVAATSKVDTKGYDIGLNFKQGPIMAGITRNAAKINNNFQTEAAVTRLGGSFDFGMGTVRALFEQAKADNVRVGALGTTVGNPGGSAAFTIGELKQTVFGVGATFNVGSGKIVGQYYVAGDVKVDGSKADDTGAKLMALGYEHSLSKRTMLKATYARIANDDAVNYDFGVNAVGINGGGLDGAAGATVSGLSLGVRHTF